MAAVARGDIILCRTLLHHGAHVNASDQDGVTPLMEAAAGEQIRILPIGGADAPFPMDVNASILFAPPRASTPPTILQMLLATGARVNAQDCYGRTALWWAVRRADKSKAALLLAHHANPNLTCVRPAPGQNEGDQVPPLLLAVGTHQMQMARLLLTWHADPNARSLQNAFMPGDKGLSPLSLALAQNDIPLLRLLLTHGGDPNAPVRTGQTLLMQAAESGQTQAAIELLARHADVNQQDTAGRTALMFAVISHSRACLEAILSRRPNMNLTDKNGTALHAALSDAPTVETLLSHGASVEERHTGDGDDLNPLWTTCVYGYTDTARVLIKHGANVNVRNKFGMTVLMRTAEYGRTECVKLLLDSGAEINAVDDSGDTALHWAAFQEAAVPAIRLLLARGADIDAKTHYHDTALTRAAANGNIGVVQALLPHEPPASLAGANGKAALKWAVRNHHPAVVRVLQDAGVRE